MKTSNKLSALAAVAVLAFALNFLAVNSHAQAPGAPTPPATGYPAPPATYPPAPATSPQKFTSPTTPAVKRPPSDSLYQRSGDTLTPRARPNPPAPAPPPHLN